MIKATPLLGYQPDLPPDTPGVIVSSGQCLPTDRGIGNGWGLDSASSTVTAVGGPLGGFESVDIAGTTRPYIGTSTKIYELVVGVATDRSGTAYSANAAQQWSFAQYGNTCLAINKGDRLQASTGGAFANAAADAPTASCLIVAGEASRPFAMLFDYNDGTDVPHGAYWNPDPTLTWTPDIATQVGFLAVVDTNGKFTAAVPYRDGALSFKSRALYEWHYTGNQVDQWVASRISSDIGCLGPNAVCLANDVVYFADANGLWEYDGSYPKPIPGAIHQWFANNHGAGVYDVRLTWDKQRHVLWVRYSTDFGDGLHLAFNPRSKLWTFYGIISDGVTVTVGHLIGPTYGATFEGTSTRFVALSKGGVLSLAGTLRFGAIGAEYGMVTMRSLRPHWLQGPTDTTANWCSATLYHGPTLRNVDNLSFAASSALPGRFDGVLTDRYIQPQIDIIAGQTWELDRISTDGAPAGNE